MPKIMFSSALETGIAMNNNMEMTPINSRRSRG